MRKRPDAYIPAQDCLPIAGISPGSDKEKWLRELCVVAKTNDLALKLGSKSEGDDEPIASFDASTGCWTAGRYVGEVHFKGRTLCIEPRFGMPVLNRWLSRIWGVKLLPSSGQETHGKAWLWWLLAVLWRTRLVQSNRHGLPYVRIQRESRSPYVKGRIRVRDTGFEIKRGTGQIVSEYRERQVDPAISAVLTAAHDILDRNLKGDGGVANWLTPKAADTVGRMRAAVTQTDVRRARSRDQVVRFTPMTELYKPVVDLSKSILRNKPISGADTGKKKVFGVLLDIAEVWEYYVYRLLCELFPEMEVLHTGRVKEPEGHLLYSRMSGRELGSLYPDICVRNVGSSAIDYIVDAKYKSAITHAGYPPQREDLYQITSYLASLGKADGSTMGVIAYPIVASESVSSSWQGGNPWEFQSENVGRVCFLGIPTKEEVSLREAMTTLEW